MSATMQQTTSGATGGTTTSAASTGAPACPKCSGPMWDNRTNKRNPKAPDFKCRDRSCDGVLWPRQHEAAGPIVTAPRGTQLRGHAGAAGAPPGSNGGERSGNGTEAASGARRAALRRCYLDVTDFVLTEVRPRYQDAGVPCTDATIAAITATLFIGLCRSGQQGREGA